MKVLAITQARYGSTRLPAKILKEVDGKTLLEIHLSRILQAKKVDQVKIATTDEEGSKYIVAVADKLGIDYHKGSVEDVLTRFYGTAEPESPDYVIRLTSDCPLIDPSVIDYVIEYALDGDYDYVITDSNEYPDGLDTEVFRFSALKKAYEEANMTSQREHVTPYIRNNGSAEGGTMFKTSRVSNPIGKFNANDNRITIDEPEDFEVIKHLIQNLGIEKTWKEYIDYLNEHPEVKQLNSKFRYNEGMEKSIKSDKVFIKK